MSLCIGPSGHGGDLSGQMTGCFCERSELLVSFFTKCFSYTQKHLARSIHDHHMHLLVNLLHCLFLAFLELVLESLEAVLNRGGKLALIIFEGLV